jgi:hypothetical protein
MPRFKSKLTPDERKPEQMIVPDRVQKLVNLQDKNKIEYPWTEQDRLEQLFEYRRSLKPKSYKYDIQSIYRLRDGRGKNEYYFYIKQGHVLNDNDVMEDSPSLTYGFGVEYEHQLKLNPATREKEPVQQRQNPTYFYKWEPKEVRELLEASDMPCENFYLANTAKRGQGNTMIEGLPLQIYNEDDFIEGNYDELALLAKSGKSEKTKSLHLVREAKADYEKKQKEEIQKHIK